MIIHLNKEHTQCESKIRSIIEWEIMNNPNLNAWSYTIELDDYTWVEGIEEIEGTILLRRIFKAIEEGE